MLPLPGHRCYVIAEAGVNHNGDPARARQLVHEAKRVGADAVKFQTFRAANLVVPSARKAEYQLKTTDPGESQFDMLRRLELEPRVQRELAELCRAEGIEFLSTPYNFEDVDFLDSLGVRAFKLASIHLVEPPFLQYVASKGKTMIVSTGMGTLDDVRLAVESIREVSRVPIVLLQCTTNYPSAAEDANLRALATLREAFELPVGYSDHTQTETCCVAAVALGAMMIEKHFTLDKALPGPDHSSAADPAEFARLIAHIRETESALGTGVKLPSAAEAANAPAMRRSIVARRAIAVGEVITEEALTLKRPGTGLPPREWKRLLGLAAPRAIAPDESLAFLLPVEIHPLRPADAPALAHLLQDARAEYVAAFNPFPFDEESVRAQLAAARRDGFWALRSGGELAGFFMLRGRDAGYARPAFGVFVAEPFSRRGLARLALEEAIRWCAAQGVEELMLTVHPENAGARKLYEEAGFRATGGTSGQGHLIMVRQAAP